MPNKLKRVLLLAVVFCLAQGQGVRAEKFDTLIGAVAPQGGAYLVKGFAVSGGSVISGVVVYSNDLRTKFPRVSILKGPAATIATATVLAEVKQVRSINGKHRSAVSFTPIVIDSPQDIYVAIELPATAGIRELGNGAGVGAWVRSEPTRSYFAADRDSDFGRMEVDYSIELVFQTVGKATQEEPKQAVLRTFLRTGSPNPSAGQPRIEFGLELPGEVTVSIYDVSGRRVRQLVKGKLSPGVHERHWDGRDDSGREVAAGIYMVRFVAPDAVFTEKLVFTK